MPSAGAMLRCMDLTSGIGLVLVIAAIAAVGGISFGIVILAPRLSRLLDRPDSTDEESRDRPA